MIDGLCDGAPPLGRALLDVIAAADLPAVARGVRPARLASALTARLAADPTAAFIARIVDAFLDLLRDAHPQEAVRDRIADQLADAIEAERRSVDAQSGPEPADSPITWSRRTSVLPFQIIESIVTGAVEASPGTGTLLGEAMWRIDDLVDLTQDVARGALNGVLLTATGGRHVGGREAVAALESLLGARAIPEAAARAAAHLDAGLRSAEAAGCGRDARELFLTFVQRYAGIPAPHRVP